MVLACACLKYGGTSVPNNLAVDSAGDAVLELQVHLRNGVVREDGGIRDITCMEKTPVSPNCSSE